MNRRQFCATVAASVVGARFAAGVDGGKLQIMTVSGPVPATEIGVTLVHEHVLVDFIGADKVTPDRYDADEVAAVMTPFLEKAKAAGCQTLFECTPAWLGRDGRLLRRLSEAAGMRLVTNTGYYGAVAHKYLPAHAHAETADELAARWIKEARDGIDGTDVRPGFIKIGVDAGPLSEVNRKLVRAAARTHLATGLTIAAHTGNGEAAMQQLDILAEEGVSPSAWIWVHAHIETDLEKHISAAKRGAWIEFDGVGPDSLDRHAELVAAMHKAGHFGKLLISQDAGWYNVGQPRGGDTRGYDLLLREFPAALAKQGLGDDAFQKLVREHPAQAMAIRVRRSS
jgi:phosphotriesterase-related protein